MKTVTQKMTFDSPQGLVFETIDDLGVTGMHMAQSSVMMAGSKLRLTFLTSQHKGLGTCYRWYGSFLGMKIHFTVVVTRWIEGIEKIWETVGEPRLLIFSWFSMHLHTTKMPGGTLAELSISYEKPKGWYFRLLSTLFAKMYCRWCLNNMLGNTQRRLKEKRFPVNRQLGKIIKI